MVFGQCDMLRFSHYADLEDAKSWRRKINARGVDPAIVGESREAQADLSHDATADRPMPEAGRALQTSANVACFTLDTSPWCSS